MSGCPWCAGCGRSGPGGVVQSVNAALPAGRRRWTSANVLPRPCWSLPSPPCKHYCAARHRPAGPVAGGPRLCSERQEPAVTGFEGKAAGRFPTRLFLGAHATRQAATVRRSGRGLRPVQASKAAVGSSIGRGPGASQGGKAEFDVADAHDAVDGALAQFAYQREDLCGHGP